MRVTQLVQTIVGEGTYAGFSCFLVRLSGCNLHCAWCDTPVSHSPGSEMPLSSVVERALAFSGKIILLTGGEPLANASTSKIVTQWIRHDKIVIIETNGTFPIKSFLKPGIIISMDAKTPSSNECGKTCMANLPLLRPEDSLKFIVANRTDFDWAKDFLKQNPVRAEVIMQPVWGRLSPKKLAMWIIDELPQARLGVQLHKILKLP